MGSELKHTHKFRRRIYASGNRVYFCTLPDCYFKLEVELSIGKKSICNICGNEFIMDEYSIKLAVPHCRNCNKVKVKDADGSSRFVRRTANKVLNEAAKDSVNDLRTRLTNASAAVLEEDI